MERVQMLYAYPQAGEACTGQRTNQDMREVIRTYENDPSKEKVSRTATTIRRYVKANYLSSFATMTYEDECDYLTIRKQSYAWIRKAQKIFGGKSFPYAKVIEGFRELERFHFHIALPSTTYEKVSDLWGYGHVRVQRFPLSDADFIAKYMAKDFSLGVLKGRRALFTAAGYAPQRICVPLDDLEPIEILKNQFRALDVRCIESDYGYPGGGRYEFSPLRTVQL